MGVTNIETWSNLRAALKTPKASEIQKLVSGEPPSEPFNSIETEITSWLNPYFRWRLAARAIDLTFRKTLTEFGGVKLVTGREGADAIDLHLSFQSSKPAFYKGIFGFSGIDWPNIFPSRLYTQDNRNSESVNLTPKSLAEIPPLDKALEDLSHPFYLDYIKATIAESPITFASGKIGHKSNLVITASFADLHDYIKLQELSWTRRRLRLEETSNIKSSLIS
ncbi:MAG: hypothetical protein Q7S88_01055 [Candidatus Daviesbacteria bacterium]|nr:hypothetical protein [Candidatus Daviesbacteria bacterium]